MVVTLARACVVRRLNVFECVRMMTRMFVLCMLVCSAADALVVTAGCRCNIRVHSMAAVFARGEKNENKKSLPMFQFYTVLPIYKI